jgi:hypothetical protein
MRWVSFQVLGSTTLKLASKELSTNNGDSLVADAVAAEDAGATDVCAPTQPKEPDSTKAMKGAARNLNNLEIFIWQRV